MLIDKEKLEKLSKEFLTQFFYITESHFRIDVQDMFIDHICWRCESQKDFEGMETTFLEMGTLFHKSDHNGRPIILIMLDTAIQFKNQTISLIELPAPKKTTHYTNGFEHAEFVIKGELTDLISKYSDLPWETKNINKAINPDVKLNYNGITIKFHPYTLAHVVKKLE